MTPEALRLKPYGEAEAQAQAVLVDGYGEALILEGEGGFYALYYLFGLAGLRAPEPHHLPDWVEGPKGDPKAFLPPYRMARWLEDNGYQSYVNEPK